MRPPTDRMLPTAVTVRRATISSSRGGTVRVFADESRRCAIDEMSAQDKQLHGLEESVKAFVVRFGPPDPGVKHDDLIVVPGEGTLRVVSRAKDVGLQNLVYEVECTAQPPRSTG